MSESAAPREPHAIPEPIVAPPDSYAPTSHAWLEGCVLLPDRMRLKRTAESVREGFLNHLHFTLGKDRFTASGRPVLYALCYTIRDYLVKDWLETQRHAYKQDCKRVYYLSMEFMIGRSLLNSMINLELYPDAEQAMREVNLNLTDLFEIEWDAGLGNGGLGRLAACYLDSMATHKIAAHGYGLRYDYGIFYQQIVNGFQVEKPDHWLRYGTPWQFERYEYLFPVRFYGTVQVKRQPDGRELFEWVDTEEVMALAYDMPVPGYGNGCVNTLRLWGAKSARGFNLDYFNHGDYMRAVEERALTENITSVLYPNDVSCSGKELRLKQEYFLVCATLQDILRRFRKQHQDLRLLPSKVAIQLNDTHPSLAIPELMRILLDEESFEWDEAWAIATQTLSYTNHTILPEALERWSVGLLGQVLPRHLQIIFEINRRFLDQVGQRWPGDQLKLGRMSIIEEIPEKRVNMAHLSIVGSHAVNGVSQLHGDILKQETFRDFYELWPDRFMAITNGITPRLWLKASNPRLTKLITEHIGHGWCTELDELKRLVPLIQDPRFCKNWSTVKRANKVELSEFLVREMHLRPFDPDSLVDVQIKRIHEYKRQMLNILHIVHRYRQIRDGLPGAPTLPRTILFSGKAAPGYALAKLMIKLVHAVGETIAHDPKASQLLNVLFLPNYSVSLAQKIVPAADLSEQISTAGMEASGTGCMKLCLNGAVTIGTMDGANVEILEEVGRDNFFLFGHTAEELRQLRSSGYNAYQLYQSDPDLHAAIEMIRSGLFSPNDPLLFQPIVDSLLGYDPFFVCADFRSYIEAQVAVEKAYSQPDLWIPMSIQNTAHMGKFSSDRAVAEYARKIWHVPVDDRG
ncbi:MAG: glycogen/starch/alpha-glucan phosphorylase [Chlamydiia bacterium]